MSRTVEAKNSTLCENLKGKYSVYTNLEAWIWATNVKIWATKQGCGPNLGHPVPDLGQSWHAQACSVLSPVCSCSKAEMKFGGVTFEERVSIGTPRHT